MNETFRYELENLTLDQGVDDIRAQLSIKYEVYSFDIKVFYEREWIPFPNQKINFVKFDWIKNNKQESIRVLFVKNEQENEQENCE